MHIDVHPDDAEAHIMRLQRLGATLVGERIERFGIWWQVMADPEGNELCVVSGAQGPDEGDASSAADPGSPRAAARAPRGVVQAFLSGSDSVPGMSGRGAGSFARCASSARASARLGLAQLLHRQRRHDRQLLARRVRQTRDELPRPR